MQTDADMNTECTHLQIELFLRQMTAYQAALYKYSDSILPILIRITNSQPAVASVNLSDMSSLGAKIHALKMLKSKINADLEVLETEEAARSRTLYNLTVGDDFTHAMVPTEASFPAEPIRLDCPRPPKISIPKPQNVATQKPSFGVSVLKFPPPSIGVDCQESQISTEPVQAPPNTQPEPPQDDLEDVHDNCTLCESSCDLESVSEMTKNDDDSIEREDSEYIEEYRPVGAAVKKEKVKLQAPAEANEPNEPAPTRAKRQRIQTDRYDGNEIKCIKEENTYIMSDKLAKGSGVRANRAVLKELQFNYGKGWKFVPGIGAHIGKDVVVNPNGVGYKKKNNPQVGKDFFLCAQDALEYCKRESSSNSTILPKTGVIEEGQDRHTVHSISSSQIEQNVTRSPRNTEEVSDDPFHSASDSESDSICSYETLPAVYNRNSCSCASRANCRCFTHSWIDSRCNKFKRY